MAAITGGRSMLNARLKRDVNRQSGNVDDAKQSRSKRKGTFRTAE
jgi:hypothetical protein